MIITLKGANFSNANIGNLYKWDVKYVMGKGASYFGAITVEKDSHLNAIISIAEGYKGKSDKSAIVVVLIDDFALSILYSTSK